MCQNIGMKKQRLITVSAIAVTAFSLPTALPLLAGEPEPLSQNKMPLLITPQEVSRYGALRVYQGIWKAIDKSSNSDFLKTKEWKELFDKPPLELKDDKDVKKAIAILYNKTGDKTGSPYAQNLDDFVTQASSVCTQARQGKIGYIRLIGFPRQTATSEMKFSLLAMPDIEGLILDLRGNKGGYLYESLNVATLFCKEPVTLKTKTVDGKYDTLTQSGTAIFLKPLVVLIDKGTCSGGENLALELSEQRQAKLIGTTTAGVTSLRALTKTDFGYLVAVKVAEVVRRDNSVIENVGLKPDLLVEETPWWHSDKIVKPSNSVIFADKTVQAAVKELKNEIK